MFLRDYIRSKNDKFPSVKVSHDEFIRLAVESGMAKEEAEFQAKMVKGLGSECLLGDKYVGIKS